MADGSGMRFRSLAIRIAVMLGIAILYPMTVHYGVRTFVPPPQWDAYVTAGPERPAHDPETGMMDPEEAERLRAEHERQLAAYEFAEERFAETLFLVAVPAGAVAVLIGTFVAVPAVAPGLVAGGVLAITNGYMTYWDALTDTLKFVSLLAALVLLAAVGWRRAVR